MPDIFKQRMHLYIIQSIYQAVSNHDQWGELLLEIRKLSSATGAFLLGVNSGNKRSSSVITNLLENRQITSDLFVETIHTITASLGSGSNINVDAKYNGSAWQNSLASTFSSDGKLLLAVLTRDGNRRFVLGLFFRREDAGDLGLAQELMLAITPHLQIAIGIYQQLVKDREKAERLDRLFSQSVTPRAMVSEDLKLVEFNKAFERILENNRSLLKATDGYLVIESQGFQSEIDRLLSRAAQHADTANIAWIKDTETGPGWLLKADAFTPRSVTTMPFANHFVRSDAKYMLSLFKVGEHAGLSPALVSSVLGLTATEATLACELASGNAPAEIAQARGVAKNTIHNQLTSIMARHGLHRQGQLLTLLSTLTFFLG